MAGEEGVCFWRWRAPYPCSAFYSCIFLTAKPFKLWYPCGFLLLSSILRWRQRQVAINTEVVTTLYSKPCLPSHHSSLWHHNRMERLLKLLFFFFYSPLPLSLNRSIRHICFLTPTPSRSAGRTNEYLLLENKLKKKKDRATVAQDYLELKDVGECTDWKAGGGGPQQ